MLILLALPMVASKVADRAPKKEEACEEVGGCTAPEASTLAQRASKRRLVARTPEAVAIERVAPRRCSTPAITSQSPP